MIRHEGLAAGPFWAPPGGGMEFGESAKETLKREFKEETGLSIQVGRLSFITEFIRSPLHAVELFFEVKAAEGTLQTGSDPELPSLIKEARFLAVDEIDALPVQAKHGAFGLVNTSGRIRELSGYFLI